MTEAVEDSKSNDSTRPCKAAFGKTVVSAKFSSLALESDDFIRVFGNLCGDITWNDQLLPWKMHIELSDVMVCDLVFGF